MASTRKSGLKTAFGTLQLAENEYIISIQLPGRKRTVQRAVDANVEQLATHVQRLADEHGLASIERVVLKLECDEPAPDR